MTSRTPSPPDERTGRAPQTPAGARKREQILEASVRVFGSGGAAAVTHRAVAKEAKVPLGSTTYYFTDRADLLLQTMAHARQAEAVRLTSIVESLEPGPMSVDRAIAVLTEMFFDKTVADPLYDLALFEMFMEATRNGTVRSETRDWSRMIFGLVDRVLPPSDAAIPRSTVLEIVACLVDGLMLEAVSNVEMDVAHLSDRLRVVVERLCPA